MSISYRELAIYVIPLFILIPVITGISTYKVLTRPLRVIFYYILFAAVMNLLNSIGLIRHQSSATLFNIFTIGEFVLISVFYMMTLRRSWRTPVMAFMLAFTIFSIVTDFFMQTKPAIGAYSRAIEDVAILVYCLAFISQQNQLNIDKSWSEAGANWVNAAFLIYFATTLLMFPFYSYLLKAPFAVILAFWIFNDVVLVLEYILFAVGFNKAKTERGR